MASTLPDGGRHPYVGDGEEGCLRSAQMDEEEAHTLNRNDPRVDTLHASAARWRLQAAWHRIRKVEASMDKPSLAAQFISTWDTVTVEPGPDRLIVTGATQHGRTGQRVLLGVRYDQIDQLVIDLLTAKRHQPQTP